MWITIQKIESFQRESLFKTTIPGILRMACSSPKLVISFSLDLLVSGVDGSSVTVSLEMLTAMNVTVDKNRKQTN